MTDAKADAGGERVVPIGRIETPYAKRSECPYNVNSGGPPCRIVVEQQFVAGLTGLEVGGRILVLYWLDRADRERPLVAERRSGKVAGAFAARTPHRPNPIGAAMVTIDAIDGGTLTVRGLDCVNGTPLLDIKPAMRAESPAGGPGA